MAEAPHLFATPDFPTCIQDLFRILWADPLKCTAWKLVSLHWANQELALDVGCAREENIFCGSSATCESCGRRSKQDRPHCYNYDPNGLQYNLGAVSKNQEPSCLDPKVPGYDYKETDQTDLQLFETAVCYHYSQAKKPASSLQPQALERRRTWHALKLCLPQVPLITTPHRAGSHRGR